MPQPGCRPSGSHTGSAMSSTEFGSKYFSTPPETSGKHDVLETTVGTPDPMASTMGLQNPSYSEGMTASSASFSNAASSSSGSGPVMITRPRSLVVRFASSIVG